MLVGGKKMQLSKTLYLKTKRGSEGELLRDCSKAAAEIKVWIVFGMSDPKSLDFVL